MLTSGVDSCISGSHVQGRLPGSVEGKRRGVPRLGFGENGADSTCQSLTMAGYYQMGPIIKRLALGEGPLGFDTGPFPRTHGGTSGTGRRNAFDRWDFWMWHRVHSVLDTASLAYGNLISGL